MFNRFGFVFLNILAGLLSSESQELEQHLATDHHRNPTSGPLSQSQFQSFMFVQTWPPTYCKSQRCAQTPESFTIHGLWPQQTGKPGKDQLTDAILDARRTALLQYWPDLKTTDFQTSKSFWHYEYNKHGVYCTTKYSAEEYIVKALTFGESFKTRAWLAKKNIVPVAKQQYDRSAIVAAIKSSTGATPDLQCYIIGGQSYLLEVRLCLDDKLEKFINCSGKVGQCGTRIYYTPAPTVNRDSNNILRKVEDPSNLYEII